MKLKPNHIHKTLKIHLSVISFISTMLLIFLSLFLLVPKDYKGELRNLFLDTPLAKITQAEQESNRE